MAEALGVAAAVIQIVDAVNKLKKLWLSVKNAPDDLKDCVDDVQRTAQLLERNKDLYSKISGINDGEFAECMQALEDALVALRSVISDLQKRLDNSRRLGSLRFVLKKEEVSQGKRKLDRAKIFLSAAQQNLLLALQLQNNTALNENNVLLCQVLSVVQLSSQNPPSCAQTISGSSSRVDASLIHSKYAAGSATSSKHKTACQLQSSSAIYSIRFPLWLTRRCFELAYSRELSSLNFGIISYRVVGWYSPTFAAVVQGDLSMLKELLETKPATIYDQLNDGSTLFMVALDRRHLGIAQFLATHSSNMCSRMTFKYLANLIWAWFSLSMVEDVPQHFKLTAQMLNLMKHAGADEGMYREIEKTLQILGRPGPWAQWLEDMCKFGYQNIDSLPRELRIFCATTVRSFDAFEQLIGTDISAREVFEVNFNSKWNHVNLLCTISNQYEKKYQSWQTVVSEILDFDLLHKRNFRWETSPLSKILGDIFFTENPDWLKDPTNYRTQRVNKWTNYLEDIGIDLMHYGARENELFKQQKRDHYFCRPIGFYYGAKAADWKIYVITYEKDYGLAAEFWNWVENPELFSIPGAFPTLDYDYNLFMWEYITLCASQHRKIRKIRKIIKMWKLKRERSRRIRKAQESTKILMKRARFEDGLQHNIIIM